MLPLFNDLIRSVNVNIEESVATALEGEFSQFDSQFHECSTPLQTRLEQYLDHTIEIISDLEKPRNGS